MTPQTKPRSIDKWYVLVCGLQLAGDEFDLGASLTLRRLLSPLSVFDLAAAGAVGFREWAAVEPLAGVAAAEIISPVFAAAAPGYDALNKCWLASSLLVIRGFAGHLCPAASAYSWNFIAGHAESRSATFRRQLAEEGVQQAVYEPRDSLAPFQGQLLDYHLRLLLPPETRFAPVDAEEASWIRRHLDRFNKLAAEEERFRFALEAAVDWRFFKDPRAAVARVWAGIESLLAINTELVYRVSLYAATVSARRGPQRVVAFKRVRSLYGIRSKAVHGEPIADEKLLTCLHESFELLRALLLDAVERGAVRTEEDFCCELLS